MNLSHQTAFQWLLDAQEGRLSPADRQMLERHLAACEQCTQDAALLNRLTSHPAPVEHKSQLSDRQLVKGVYTGFHHRLKWEPLQGGAWAVAVFTTLVLFTWIIDQLKPNIVFAASLLGTAPRATAPPASEPWALGSLFFFSGFIAPILTGIVGLFLARRRAFGGWLTFLVVILALAFGFFYFGAQMTMRGTALYTIVDLPFLVFIAASLLVHLWEFRARWSGLTLGLLGLFGIAILIFILGPWWDKLDNSTFSERLAFSGYFLVIVMILTLAWKAWQWRQGWRWLGIIILGLSFAGVIASQFILSPYLLQRNSWLQGMLSLGSIFWTFLATFLAARCLLYILQTSQTPRTWRRLVAGLVIALCFGSLYVNIYQITLTNSVSEDALLGTIMIWVVCIAAVLALVQISWKLTDWRIWVATAVMLLFLGGLIPATIIPDGVTAAITEQRVQEVNQAVLRYQVENGHYPASLADLEPRYLLQVPPPITAFRQSWCYQSGANYYELGYYDAFHFDYPGFIKVKTYASAGTLPAGFTDCEKSLLDAIH